MPKKRPFRVPREQPGGINPGSFGRKSNVAGLPSIGGWASQMSASAAGASEVMVRITGGGRDADGVQAHMEYIDRHGKLEVETDHGEVLQGKTAGTETINDWAVDYGRAPDAPHGRGKVGKTGKKQGEGPRQAINIVLSMPPGTPPDKVLQAAKKFARENFANQHRYMMTLHTNDEDWNRKHNPGFENKRDHGKHPHVHLVVKVEHEYGGPRLNPRVPQLMQWREQFAEYITEQGVPATATRRKDRGLAKTSKKSAIYRASKREPKPERLVGSAKDLYTAAGDSTFMRKKMQGVARELGTTGTVEDQRAYGALLDARASVVERYQAGIDWLQKSGRHEEAKRLELMLQQLPPVRSEKQLIAEELLAREGRAPAAEQRGRTR